MILAYMYDFMVLVSSIFFIFVTFF